MSSVALNVKELRPKPVALKASAESAPSVTPPPLPSMRVPKGTVRQAESEDADREWALRATESKARIAAAEERAWQAQLLKAKALLEAQEEQEWSSLRMRSGAPTRSAEEREWAELMLRARARSIDPQPARPRPQRPPRRKPAALPLAPAARPQAPAPRVVLWP
jgi:hypothetical protein